MTIYGPFIKYKCTKCGADIESNVGTNEKYIKQLTSDLLDFPERRICAGCAYDRDRSQEHRATENEMDGYDQFWAAINDQ